MLKLGLEKSDFPKKGPSTATLGACCTCCCCFFWVGGLIGAAVATGFTNAEWQTQDAVDDNRRALTQSRKAYWLTILLSICVPAVLGLLMPEIWWVAIVPFPLLNVIFATIASSVSVGKHSQDEALKSLVRKRNLHIFVMTLVGYAVGWGILILVLSS